MRISDWSSDVCSSDLQYGHPLHLFGHGYRAVAVGQRPRRDREHLVLIEPRGIEHRVARAGERERGVDAFAQPRFAVRQGVDIDVPFGMLAPEFGEARDAALL